MAQPARFQPGREVPDDHCRPIHTLRHAFITAALDAGVPLPDVQEAASHADPRTTMRYDNSRKLHQSGEKMQVA